MSTVPTNPVAFFEQYVPARFASVASAVAGRSSPGALELTVTGHGPFSLRLVAGALKVERATAADAVLRAVMNEEDFVALVVQAASEVPDGPVPADAQAGIAKALSVDGERLELIRTLRGSLVLELTDGAVIRRVALAPGADTPSFDEPKCKVELALEDLRGIQRGEIAPIELMFGGRMKLSGDPQLPMAIAGALV